MRRKLLLYLVTIVPALMMTVACGSTGKDNNSGQDMGNSPLEFSNESIIYDSVIKKDVYIEGVNVGGLKQSEVLNRIRETAVKMDIEPENAALDPVKWIVVRNEKQGKKVNIEKTLEKLLNSAEGAKQKFIVEKVQPQVTADKLRKNIVEIASYSTPILDKQWGRMNNIQLASGKINYMILNPGDEFSFNRVVGRRTEAKGYEDAPIIVNTKKGAKKKNEIGGGICQLSSTLYNAVEKCAMEITERHMHSKDVPYVPEGKDATVAFGNIDFKFRNNRNLPVMIRINVTKSKLSVRLLENRN